MKIEVEWPRKGAQSRKMKVLFHALLAIFGGYPVGPAHASQACRAEAWRRRVKPTRVWVTCSDIYAKSLT
jgi:hypothetical protein